MRDERGLGGYGIKGLRKNLLTQSPQRSPSTQTTIRHYAECRNEGLAKSWYLSEDFTTLCQMSKCSWIHGR